MNAMIALLLQYSFEPIGWNFDMLTEAERDIIKTPERLQQLRQLSATLKERI